MGQILFHSTVSALTCHNGHSRFDQSKVWQKLKIFVMSSWVLLNNNTTDFVRFIYWKKGGNNKWGEHAQLDELSLGNNWTHKSSHCSAFVGQLSRGRLKRSDAHAELGCIALVGFDVPGRWHIAEGLLLFQLPVALFQESCEYLPAALSHLGLITNNNTAAQPESTVQLSPLRPDVFLSCHRGGMTHKYQVLGWFGHCLSRLSNFPCAYF